MITAKQRPITWKTKTVYKVVETNPPGGGVFQKTNPPGGGVFQKTNPPGGGVFQKTNPPGGGVFQKTNPPGGGVFQKTNPPGGGVFQKTFLDQNAAYRYCQPACEELPVIQGREGKRCGVGRGKKSGFPQTEGCEYQTPYRVPSHAILLCLHYKDGFLADSQRKTHLWL